MSDLRQWIIHSDGTWIWSAGRPYGGAPRGPLQAYELPDANKNDQRFWYIQVPVFKPPSTEPSMELVAHEMRTLRYAKVPLGGTYQWMLMDAVAQQPSRCDDLRFALQTLVDRFRAANGSLTLDLAEAIFSAERTLAK